MVKAKETIENITPYQTDKYKIDWRLKLDSNENIYGINANILSAIKNFSKEDISLYPNYGKLIDKLSGIYSLKEDNFLLTNGCDEALSILINTYIDKDDEFLSYNPSFVMPVLYSKIAGAKIKLVDYDEKYVFDYEKLKDNITQNTKIIYIATPNNPTGEIAKPSCIELLLKENKDVLFIVDCTYINYSSSVVFEDYIDLVRKYDNIALVKSFSKDYALAGLRIGFVVGDNQIINNLKKVSSPYNVNAIAVNCAIASLNDYDTINEIKELNNNARELLFKGLMEKGFKPYKSEANFILCDFYSYCDFYYEKLKKNGVITRNFSKNSPLKTCLRITVPTIGGVKYINELLNKKPLLIFDIDGVIIDNSKSCLETVIRVFKHFSGEDISFREIIETKNLGSMNCDYDLLKYLLKKYGHDVDMKDIVTVFQDIFYNPKIKKDNYLIDKEELLIPKDVFEELSKTYDLAIFTGRFKNEALYSLKKFGLDKYFYYYSTSDNLAKNMQKPNPKGALDILEHCPYLSVKYFGDNVDDIIAGNGANIETIGVISPWADKNTMINNFRHLGASYILENINDLKTFLEKINSSDNNPLGIM